MCSGAFRQSVRALQVPLKLHLIKEQLINCHGLSQQHSMFPRRNANFSCFVTNMLCPFRKSSFLAGPAAFLEFYNPPVTKHDLKHSGTFFRKMHATLDLQLLKLFAQKPPAGLHKLEALCA